VSSGRAGIGGFREYNGSVGRRRSYWLLALALAPVGCGSSSAAEDRAETGAGGSSSGGAGFGGEAGGGRAGASSSGQGGAGSGAFAGTMGGSDAAGDGGSNTGGGAGSGAASGSSGAGSSGVGPSEAEACLAYAAASCKRRAACTNSDAGEGYGCAYGCPDVVFAPGSTRTASALLECAQAFETLPCEDLAAGVYPACVTPGTRKVGEPCLFSAQCESLECKVVDLETCGTCARVVGENEDCTSPDTDCGGDRECIEGICQVPTYVYKELGETCTSEYECDTDAYCDGVCVSLPTENESCEMFDACVSGLYCAAPDQLCRPEPVLNEPCGSAVGTSYPWCGPGLACNAATPESSGICVMVVVVEPGASCSTPALRCPSGTICSCTDDACVQKFCAQESLLGEPCGDGVNACAPPLECLGGACRARSYQGLYEEACAP